MHVLALCGSLRKESYNRKALHIAKGIAKELGATVEEFDLGLLPLFNEDVEAQGDPEVVKQFKEAATKADILLIASPEYNRSITAALKNGLDWLSRGDTTPIEGKVAAFFGASPGPYGTIRGQEHLRQVLAHNDVYFLPGTPLYIRNAAKAFKEDGSFVDEAYHNRMRELLSDTFDFAKKLRG